MNRELEKRNDKPLQDFNAKNVVLTLQGLMTKVTKEKCTAETVNAACNCAGKITDILRVHLEAERLSLRK